jgi:pyruvate-ferredoxin/flavodoxin oxidoreductase
VIPVDEAIAYLKDQIKKLFGKKGDKIVNMNNEAVDKTLDHLVEVDYPAAWADAGLVAATASDEPEWVTEVMKPMLAQQGDKLPVSAFSPDGIFPVATTQYEKRGVAINVPEWIMDNCIQCNQCAMVCPHAAIRPVLVTEDELKGGARGLRGQKSPGQGAQGVPVPHPGLSEDCMGCGNCADICPAKKPALVMKPLDTQIGTAGAQSALCLQPAGARRPGVPQHGQGQPVLPAPAGVLRRLCRMR